MCGHLTEAGHGHDVRWLEPGLSWATPQSESPVSLTGLPAHACPTAAQAEAANMLIKAAAEQLAAAARLAAAGEGGEAPAPAAERANGDASAAAAGLEGAGEGDEEEAEGMSPLQTAQHFAMRNLMNAGGWVAAGG